MAGVTFLLERHLNRPSFSRTVLRESIEAFEAVGPWFLTLLCLVTMGITIQIWTSKIPVLFYLSITYASAISLIISSPFQAMLTRFMADEIFRVNYQSIINSLISVSVCVIIAALSIASLSVFTFSSIALNQKIAFVSLTVLFSMFWCISACLAALQKERVLLILFSIGIGVILALFRTIKSMEMVTLTVIFSIGIAIPVAGGYAYTIKLYIRSCIKMEWYFLKREKSIRNAFSMFIFYLGFWIDKVVFWHSGKSGISYDSLFHYCPKYDFPFFIAMTFMMIGSIFVYRGMKRKISEPYKAFIFKLENNFPFREISLEKYKIVDGISQVSLSLLMFYGGFVLFILFIVYLGVIPLPWGNPFVFHYLLLGTVFFSLYFFYFLLLQYLDEYSVIIRINLLFFLLNLIGSLISVQYGFKYHGTGFLIASIISSVLSFLITGSKVGGLEYHVFHNALKQTDEA